MVYWAVSLNYTLHSLLTLYGALVFSQHMSSFNHSHVMGGSDVPRVGGMEDQFGDLFQAPAVWNVNIRLSRISRVRQPDHLKRYGAVFAGL